MTSSQYELETRFVTRDAGQGVGAVTWQVGDFDGDGRSEVIQAWRNGDHLGLIRYAWDGNGLSEHGSNPNPGHGVAALQWLTGDLNGDRRTDLIQLYENHGRLGVIVYAWSPAEMKMTARWSTPDIGQGASAIGWLVGDVNGDGRAELVQLYNNGGRLGMIVYGESQGALRTIWWTPDAGQGSSALRWLVADVNGDGRAELIQLWNSSGKLGMIVHGWRDGGMHTLWQSNDLGVGVDAIEWLTGDVNADRRSEVIQVRNVNGRAAMWVYGWSGAGMRVLSSSSDLGHGPNAIRWFVGDINGGGSAEVVQLWNSTDRLGMIVYGWAGGRLSPQWVTRDAGQGSGAVVWAVGRFSSGARTEVLQLWKSGDQLGMILYGRPPTVINGQLRPRYKLLYLLYALPGTTGGSDSKLSYGEGSTLGSRTAVSSSFRVGVSVTAKVSVGGAGGGASASSTVDFSTTTGDTESINVTKSQGYTVDCPPPARDGIDHDRDLYYLWLNPVVDVTLVDGRATWSFANDGSPMDVVWVYGSWLKNPAEMDPNVRVKLERAGLTAADFASLLALNPFSQGATVIDRDRYLLTQRMLPYQASDQGQKAPRTTFELINETTDTSGTSLAEERGVSVTLEVSAEVPEVLKASTSSTNSFRWSESSSRERSTRTTQKASVTLAGPSGDYRGEPNVEVYWDRIFNSFMFAFPSTPPTASGRVTDAAGKALVGEEVTLNVGGRRARAFSDRDGQYRFYLQGVGGVGSVEVRGQAYPQAVGPDAPPASPRLRGTPG